MIAIAFGALAAVAAWAVVRAISDRQEDTHEKQLATAAIASPS
jgi:type II secretory pathway component PulJ